MPSPPPPPPPAPPRLAPAAAAASLTAERFRAQKRADAVAVQKRARDGRVLARRLEGITRLASGVDLGEDSDDDDDDDDDDGGQGSAAMEVEQPEAGPSSGPWPGKGKKGTGKGKGKKASREALREVLTWASLFTLSPTLASPPLPTSGELVADYLALGPIPNGKRCLLVTGPGRGTTAPTTLHTRVSARVLLKWVAPLPGGTVLDCLLPNDWKATGVLYVLDCLRWKEMDIAASGATLRQFFLRSRLSELAAAAPLAPAPAPAATGHKHPTAFLALPYLPPPIAAPQWATLRSSGMQHGEGVMILGAEGSYVFGDEKDVGEAWWVGPEEVDDLLAVVSGLAHPG